MLDWLRMLGRKRGHPLKGAPTIQRRKTYTSESGYVYEYYYQGQRPAQRANARGTEFVFQVSPDRRHWFQVCVLLSGAAVESWECDRRPLSSTECYAIAKMSLFQAFDEREPSQMRREIVARRADIDAILDQLGID